MSVAAAVGDPDDPSSPVGPAVAVADERCTDELAVDSTAVDGESLGRLLAGVLAAEGAPSGSEASLFLVDPDRIAQLKAEHLEGDGSPTDVLSFPLDGVSEDSELIGDVFLCVSVAAQQAPDHAGSVDDELALLVVHGGLHLAGWDHVTDDERKAMWGRERELLTALHGRPARDPWGGPTK